MIDLTKEEKEFIRMFKLASKVVMLEDIELLKELAKERGGEND